MEGFEEFIKGLVFYIVAICIIATMGFFAGRYVGYQDGITKCNNETIMKQLSK